MPWFYPEVRLQTGQAGGKSPFHQPAGLFKKAESKSTDVDKQVVSLWVGQAQTVTFWYLADRLGVRRFAADHKTARL